MTSRLAIALTVESLFNMTRYTVTRDFLTDDLIIRDTYMVRTMTITREELAGPYLHDILRRRRWEVVHIEKGNEK